METTFNTYRDRIDEIELYFNGIKDMYHFKDELYNFEYDNDINDEVILEFINKLDQSSIFKDDYLKIIKANIILMIYNLVESSIMGGILEIYGQVKEDGKSYNEVCDEIQSIWFSFKFNQVYDKKAHYNSYRDKAREIITDIMNSNTIELDRKATDISGNLDADKIRDLCKNHGIRYSLSPDTRGGYVLKDVKDKRNYLAHGTMSFVECGRDYTIEELEKIKNETKIFINDILLGMKEYYDNKLYLKSV